MKLYSSNEYDQLKQVILGTATNAHWPSKCPVYRESEKTTKWKESPVPSGPVEQFVIDEANEDLEMFSRVLKLCDVEVFRPKDLDFASFDGMYNYCPRDRLLVIDDIVVDAPMKYPTRMREIDALSHLIDNDIIYPKSPSGSHNVMFDAANIIRLGDGKLLYLVSESGNVEGGKWLQKNLGKKYDIEILDSHYSGVHLDSTIMPVAPGIAIVNSTRVSKAKLPKHMKNWDIIWMHNPRNQSFHKYPYASNFISMNVLSVNPQTVICDTLSVELRDQLDKRNIETIGVTLRHARTLGGGHHCTTLDMLRV